MGEYRPARTTKNYGKQRLMKPNDRQPSPLRRAVPHLPRLGSSEQPDGVGPVTSVVVAAAATVAAAAASAAAATVVFAAAAVGVASPAAAASAAVPGRSIHACEFSDTR